MDFPDVPPEVLAKLRPMCLALPEATETQNQVGYEFKIRRRIFAYLFAVEDPDGRQIVMLVCRADPLEREGLLGIGHPYFPPRSGTDRVGIVIEDGTDWTEIEELVTESYRLNAPKNLASLVE